MGKTKKNTKKNEIKDDYFWSLSGQGTIHPGHDGEPNSVISAWDLTLLLMDDEGEVKEPALGKIPLSVVDQVTAANLGEDLYDVYDAEDALHFDYYEHAKASDDEEELFDAAHVVIVATEDLVVLPLDRLLDFVEILSRIFANAVIAIYHPNLKGDKTARYLATVLSSLPKLSGDKPKEGWFYHDTRCQLFVK